MEQGGTPPIASRLLQLGGVETCHLGDKGGTQRVSLRGGQPAGDGFEPHLGQQRATCIGPGEGLGGLDERECGVQLVADALDEVFGRRFLVDDMRPAVEQGGLRGEEGRLAGESGVLHGGSPGGR
jgi:hypothetical protein